MFRIRRVYDDNLPVDRDAILQVQDILREQFPLEPEEEMEQLPEMLRNPLKYRFNTILFIAEGNRRRVKGLALLLHAPDLRFCYLDYISTASGRMGRGFGSALFERVRIEARALGVIGLFFECLQASHEACPDPSFQRQNAARLRFYERYGARPIANTAYETPCTPHDTNPPHLVFDGLGQGASLRRGEARAIVRAILERKYSNLCSPEYVRMVVESFTDDPVRLCKPRYVKMPTEVPPRPCVPPDTRIVLIVNDRHAIHHVREKGYIESPVRIAAILRELGRTDLFTQVEPRTFAERHITRVHDPRFVDYIKRVCRNIEPGSSVYPYVFPLRNRARPPKELSVRAGYYCIDTFTPLNRNAYLAAKRAVDCALTAAGAILAGHRLTYALVRPPGHHAERSNFGGFCYFLRRHMTQTSSSFVFSDIGPVPSS